MNRLKTRQKIRKALLFISFALFPATFYYFSPAIPLMAAAEGLIAGSLLVFAILFLGSLFLGRAFCGWVCPAGAIEDITAEFRSKKLSPKIGWIKYLVWVPWLLLLLFLFRRAGGLRGLDFFYQTELGLSVTNIHALIIYLIVVFTFLLLALIIGRRAACHTICWIAPFMVLGRKLSLLIGLPKLHLRATSANCISCMRCEGACPMSLPVQKMVRSASMEHSSCILCARCIDTCKHSAISYSILKPRTPSVDDPKNSDS